MTIINKSSSKETKQNKKQETTEKITEYGLLVVTPTKTYDVSHNYDDEEYIEFVLFMSRREYKTILKRLERGRRQAVDEGNFLGSYRPYGYDILKNRAGRTLIPNAEEAPIVKKIFEWTVDDHMTPGKIAKKLTAMGVPTYRGDTDWNLSTIKTILSNPVYCGKVRWNDEILENVCFLQKNG